MNKKTFILILLFSLFLIAFNILYFIYIDFKGANSATWISYGFIHLSYIVFILSIFLIKKSKADNSYDIATAFVTWKYFCTAYAVGVGCIFKTTLVPQGLSFAIRDLQEPFWPLLTQTIIAVTFIAWWLASLWANEVTAESMTRQEQDHQFIKNGSLMLNGIVCNTSDEKIRRVVERCYDVMSSSPERSHASVQQLEQKILDAIGDMERASRHGNTEGLTRLADDVTGMLRDRNRILQMNH